MPSRITRELHDLDVTELQQRLDEVKLDLTNFRFRLATLETQDTAKLGEIRRQIARIKTILAERERET